MHTLYTAGYTATWSPEQLRDAATQLNAQLWDIRFSPNSRVPRWRKEALRAAVGPAYVHMGCLGNANYLDGGPIRLARPEAALQPVARVLERQPIILLCACQDYLACHRKTAADYLVERLGCQARRAGCGEGGAICPNCTR